MTFEGTLQKIGILFGLMTISALGTVVLGLVVPGLLYPMMMFGMVGTIGIALYLMFSRPSDPQTTCHDLCPHGRALHWPTHPGL